MLVNGGTATDNDGGDRQGKERMPVRQSLPDARLVGNGNAKECQASQHKAHRPGRLAAFAKHTDSMDRIIDIPQQEENYDNYHTFQRTEEFRREASAIPPVSAGNDAECLGLVHYCRYLCAASCPSV
jgi:hypothetical protein